MSAIEQAPGVLASLEAKRFAAEGVRERLAQERAAIAYAAHTGGDAKARKRLDEVNAESAKLGGELASIGEAIAEAKARVKMAKADADREIVAAQAGRALEISVTVKGRTAKMDTLLAAFFSEASALKTDLDALHALGCTHPNHGQLQSLGERALKTAAMESPFKIEHLAPRERRNFGEIGEAFSAQIERWADACGAPAKAEAA